MGDDNTSAKSYLSQQIKLMTISTTDLFTDEEYEAYLGVVNTARALNEEELRFKKHKLRDPTVKQALLEEKRRHQQALATLIAKHEGAPRAINLKLILDSRLTDEHTRYATWQTLKPSRKIQEFSSEFSRAMGLAQDEVTFDKIIVKWKSEDILRQIVTSGFDLAVFENGEIKRKHYVLLTASAGQLRTDKVQFIEEQTWLRIQSRLMCGLSFDEINRKGGINVNKLLAYIALACSATDPWTDFDIDRSIVIDDFEAPVQGLVDFIDKDYNLERCVKETVITHTDGIGMMLPRVSRKNFQIRAPWIKGLMTSFDFLRFCEENHIEPKLTDIYGKTHDLVDEDIRVIFTKSQFKLYKYYDSWEDYKQRFKKNGCTFNLANAEDDYVKDTSINYQMIQTLTSITEEEIDAFVSRTHSRIKNLSSSAQSMLEALNARPDSPFPYQRSLAIYPELLRDGYSKEALKALKLRMLLDAKSGAIKCENKRLFAIPDMYAACEYWFKGEERPVGILRDGEIACRAYRHLDEADCLRSPHLYMEHAIRTIVHDSDVYSWFYTNGVYTSCHDLISKILQFSTENL